MLIYKRCPHKAWSRGFRVSLLIKLFTVSLLQVLPIYHSVHSFFFFLASRHFHFASRTKIMVRDVRLLIAIEQYSKAVFEIIWKCMVLAILLSVIVPKEPRQSQPIRFRTKTRHDWVTRFLIALHAVCLFLLSVLISSVMLLCSDCRIISLRLVLGHWNVLC